MDPLLSYVGRSFKAIEEDGSHQCQSTYSFILEDEGFFQSYPWPLLAVHSSQIYILPSENYTQSRTSKLSTGNPSFVLNYLWKMRLQGCVKSRFLLFFSSILSHSFTHPFVSSFLHSANINASFCETKCWV